MNGVVSPGPEWESQYLQVGYNGGKQLRARSPDGYSNVDGLKPLDRVDAKSYYTQFGVIPGTPLQLPISIEDSLAAYDKLTSDARAKFCRASYWAQVSAKVFTISQSASFAALVSAIEVFLPNPEHRCTKCGRHTSTNCCSECHQPQAGPTKAFRDFLEEFVPGIPAAHRNKLYSVRSSLSHGSSLVAGDLAEIGFRFTPKLTESWQERLLLSEIVQLVLVNWLRKQ